MRLRIVVGLLALATFELQGSSPAFACSDCEYEACAFGKCACFPKSGCVVQQVIQPQIDLAGALLSGDSKRIQETAGKVFLNTTCFMCREVAHQVLPNLSDEQLNQIAGRGVITYIGTGSPVLVAIDVARQMSIIQPVEQQTIPGIPLPTKPTSETFTTTAACIFTAPADKVGFNSVSARAQGMSVAETRQMTEITTYVGWSANPTFKKANGQTSSWDDVWIADGDTLIVTAPYCKEMDQPNLSIASKTSAQIKVKGRMRGMGGGPRLNTFIWGSGF